MSQDAEVEIRGGIEPVALTSDPNKMLANNQILRQKIANLCMDQVASDPKMAKVVLSSLKDMDSQVLTLRRLEQDNQNAQSDRDTAIALAQQADRLAMATGNRNPFKRDDENSRVANAKDITPVLPNVAILPGQLDQGAVQDTYENFITQFDEQGNRVG